ncbi:MAG: LysM peptidoglycan-binding domain-containing protein [Patescibacteria group bacterium]|jgi:hypothetical protein
MFKRLLCILSLFACALALPVFAQELLPLSVRAAQQAPDGVDRILKFTIANTRDRAIEVQGRVVVINVYSTSAASSLPTEKTIVPAGGTADVSVRWHDAPIFGQIRTTVILNEGSSEAVISSYTFWLLPNGMVVGGGAAALFASIAIVHLLMRPREPKKIKVASKKTTKVEVKRAAPMLEKPPEPARVPVTPPVPEPPKPKPTPPPKPKPLSNTLAYRVEPDDSVMTLSSRFDLSWQEIVRTNRLKPPYTLRPGTTIQIPRHSLKPKPPAA